MAWRSTGRNSHLTVNPAPQHPRRRGPGAGSSAVQRWLSPVSHQGLGGCPWSRGATGNFGANFANFFLGVESRRSERLRQQQRGPQTGFVHLETDPPAPEGARGSPACPPRAPAPPGPGPPCHWSSSDQLYEAPGIPAWKENRGPEHQWFYFFFSAKSSGFHLRRAFFR